MPLSQNSFETFLAEIERFPAFEGLSREKICRLLSGGSMQASKHRDVLYRSGDEAHSCALVLRGAYKLIRSSARGDDVIMYFSSPGDVVAALIMPQPQAVYPVSVVSMGPSLVWKIPRKIYFDEWMKDPEITMRIQNLLFNRMSLLQDEKTMNKSPLSRKVAFLLLQLMERYSAEEEKILPIPLTRKEIADSLGSTVESVIRIMSDWSHQGIVKTHDQYIEILEPSKVVELLKD
ncbi:MAG: Crp/Fnr family transcriptional regulator [Pseudobdellovibrionaceae bacterium]